jgi:SAM-dependent MidA family methyltransferase
MFSREVPRSSESLKIIVELGMGDGRLLNKLLEADKEADRKAANEKSQMYIGIELDRTKYERAKSLLENFDNVKLINGSFEVLINEFPDRSIDEIISVLPDSKFIDIESQDTWENFYRVVNQKMSKHGRFLLVTELIDDLLQPVSNEAYHVWLHWIIDTFQNLGFIPVRSNEGPPDEYESECLERFKSDPERIRLATFDFVKRART